jgi:prefoldin beta subunit
MNEMISKKQGLITKLNENSLVKQELDMLEKETPVFKLIGAVLVKNDLEEAQANVNQRIKYIESDIKRMDNKLDKMKKEHTVLGENLVKLQQEAAAKAAAQQK